MPRIVNAYMRGVDLCVCVCARFVVVRLNLKFQYDNQNLFSFLNADLG